MKSIKFIKLANIFKAILLKRKIPLFIAWAITLRCNKKCLYCGFWHKRTPELFTHEILKCITMLQRFGTWGISFTGGEPLLREDIPEIINFASARGLFTKIDTNGSLIPSRINELKKVDMVFLSLDGPQKANDKIRGKGSFLETMNAVDILKSAGKNIRFVTVISKENCETIDFILDISKKLKIFTLFQIASKYILGTDTYNVLLPEPQLCKDAIKKLIISKSKNKYIMNSSSALKYLFHFPNYPEIKCLSSRASCRIEPDGLVSWCARRYPEKQLNIQKEGLKNSILNLPVIRCDRCICADRLELNYILKGDFGAILNNIRCII